MNDRKCLECFEQLRGRTDQKFCSDQCRSSYNNRHYIESNAVVKTINRILKKNYFILSSLISEGRTSAPKSELLQKGYRFDYFTCVCSTRNSRTNYFCYDQGYREQENNKVILVPRGRTEDMASARSGSEH